MESKHSNLYWSRPRHPSALLHILYTAGVESVSVSLGFPCVRNRPPVHMQHEYGQPMTLRTCAIFGKKKWKESITQLIVTFKSWDFSSFKYSAFDFVYEKQLVSNSNDMLFLGLSSVPQSVCFPSTTKSYGRDNKSNSSICKFCPKNWFWKKWKRGRQFSWISKL